MPTNAWCRCQCHGHLLADLREAELHENVFAVAYYASDIRLHIPPLVALDDPVETLVAIGCSCVRWHCALPMSEPRHKYLPPHDWQPGDE